MAESNNNLDLTTVDSEDFEGLAQKIESFYRGDSAVKTSLAYNWERNHLMLDGKQWIVYDGEKGAGGKWQQLKVSPANEYIPRPVTNYLFDVYQTLKAYLIQHRPRSTITPNTQQYRDKMAAKLANLVVECNWDRLKEDKNYEYAASCAIVYGTVFKKDYWDTSTLQMAKVPKMQMQPMLDPQTGQVMGYEEQEVTDPQTGETLFDELPLGDVNTSVVEPYRIAVDPLATDIHNARWIMEYAIQPLDWIRETYDREGQGYTGEAADLKEEKTLSSAMQRFYALKNSSGVKSSGPNSSGAGSGSPDMIENAAVVKEYYERPSRKFPKGRLVVVANNKVLYSDRSPYEGPELGDWHPYSEFRWETVPGRLWGKSPFDPATEVQKHINSIDAAIILVRKTHAVPQKLIPTDSGIAKGSWTGRPGLEVFYRANGSPPTTIMPTGVDPQVWKEREQKVEDLKQLTGAIDILKGDRPNGVTAASALEMLFEVGTGKLRPALDRWKQIIESSQKKQLRLVSQRYREPRQEFIRLLHSKNKDISEETINKFIGYDLYDNCNVTIEAGANIPKLQSAEKSQLLQLAQTGTLNLESPQNRMEFNKRMGVVGFDNEVGPDVTRAEWENDLLDDLPHSPDNHPVVLVDENHDIHKEIHVNRQKQPSFMSLPQEVQKAYQDHINEHEQYIQQAKQMAAQEAASTGKPPAPGPEQPSAVHGHGKGISQSQITKVFSPDTGGKLPTQ
jgi:hypothetical protein